jgi:hypothetical protein
MCIEAIRCAMGQKTASSSGSRIRGIPPQK